MATSYSDFKEDVRDYLIAEFSPDIRILDVGAGEGTYYRLLKDYFKHIDAVEVYMPNIKNYKLENKYEDVYNVDIREFEYQKKYDLVIFGDVLEHLNVEDAQKVLKYAIERAEMVLVAVPYCYKQGIAYGNKYEIHLQDDLTIENMKERYPELGLLIGNDYYGYYVNKKYLEYARLM